MEVDHIEGVFTSDQLKGEGKVLNCAMEIQQQQKVQKDMI